MRYVVHSEPPRSEREFENPFKVFESCQDASEFAAAQVEAEAFKASVYEVALDDTYAAVMAVRMGGGGAPVDVRISKSLPGVDRLPTAEELGF